MTNTTPKNPSKIPGNENNEMGNLETILKDDIQISTKQLGQFYVDMTSTFGFFNGNFKPEGSEEERSNSDEYKRITDIDEITEYLSKITGVATNYVGKIIGEGRDAIKENSELITDYLKNPGDYTSDPEKFAKVSDRLDRIKAVSGIDLEELRDETDRTGKLSIDRMKQELETGEKGIKKYQKNVSSRRVKATATPDNLSDLAKELSNLGKPIKAELDPSKITEPEALAQIYSQIASAYQAMPGFDKAYM